MSTMLKNYGNENILEFIQSKIKNNNNVEKDILDKITYVEGKIIEDTIIEGTIIEDRSSQGFYYERLWDICIKFGATDLTLPSIKDKLQTYHIMDINPNNTNIPNTNSNCWDNDTLNKTPGGYLSQKVRSGSSGGYSDITFVNQKYDINGIKTGEEELYFISVKYFKEEKEIAKYDIGKLCALIEKHKATNRTIKIFIFVKNKQDAIKKFEAQNSSSNILIKYINPGGNYEHIYDLNDLQNAYFKLKKILEQFNYLESTNNISNFEKDYLKVLKEVFIPRFHQKLFVGKINTLINNGEKNILVGAIPRSGKSYVMAGTILEYIKTQEVLQPTKKLKFLLMTPAPNETFGEYQAIFNKYIEFNGIDVVTYKEGISIKEICKNANKHCIIIISKQKLGWSAGSKSEALLAKVDATEVELVTETEDTKDEDEDTKEDDEYTKEDDEKEAIKKIERRINLLFGTNPNIDVMFLDEAHFGMSTIKAQKIVNVLKSTIANTVKIYVTATYNKPLQAYGVTKNCIITWGLNDIQIMKTISDSTIKNNAIIEQFGKTIYESALEYFGDKTGLTLISKFQKDYSIFPKPYLITSLWDKEFLSTEKLKIGDTEFDWDMNKLFTTNGDSTTFANVEQIKEMMRYYFGYPDKKDKEETYIKQTFYRKRGIIPRIQNICLNKCRTLQQQHNTSQLWFLPVGTSKIKNKVSALINLLISNEFKDIHNSYHFFVAIDIEDRAKAGKTINGVTYMNDPHNIKIDIENTEKDIKNGKLTQDNLIILTGQRLQLGISLRNVDIVTLWNSTSSSDAIFQMLFRSMTEVDVPPCKENEYCAEKKFGFMVDMNPQRALTNVNLFDANISKNKDIDEKQKYRLITDVINIDEDVFYDKYEDDENGRTTFVKDLFDKLYSSWNINVENIKKIIGKFDFNMTKLEALKPVFQKIHIDKSKKMKDEIVNKEEDDVFDPGKHKEKIGETKKKDKKDNVAQEINLIETATSLIMEFISLLNIFTLYMDSGAQCILTDSSKLNAQITLITDIDVLKNEVFKNEEIRENFLKILNGRLTGNADEPYLEDVIDGVLDAMDNSDAKLIMNKIISSQKKHYYTINEPTKLLEYIDSQLKPKTKEKNENGEVFTPLTLVNEMFDKLDDAYIKEHGKSIFTEVDFKWFDPAVGIGNFPIILYERLMKGLVESIKDEEQRRKHILEQMIYASELTPKNVFIYKKIFCDDKYKLNIYEGDTLKMDVKREFNLLADFSGFDVIMGNPPFQEKVGDRKTQPLWHLFVIHSLIILKTGGYLVFVHPSGWRSPEGLFKNILDLVQSKNLKYLCMNDFKKGQEVFKVGTNFDYYVLQNTIDPNNITIITDINETTIEKNINSWKFIPSGGFDLYEKILTTKDEERVNVLYNSSLFETRQDYVSKEKTPEYKYPCVYTITKRDGIKFFYSSIQHPKTEKKDMFVPKVIWSNGLGTYPIIDLKGEYGLTQFSYAIIDDVNYLKNIETALNNPKFIELMEYVKFQNNKYNYKIISLFKKDFWKEFIYEEKDNEDKVKSKKTPTKLEIASSSQSAKIYNPLTDRYIKNTPTNQKKIEQLSLKKTAGKRQHNKKSRNKKSRNKKSQKQKHKKTRSRRTRKLTRKLTSII